MSHRIPTVYIAQSPLQGLGVFASDFIEKNSIIELCPLILLTTDDVVLVKQSSLNNYYFDWDAQKKNGVIALGYGSIYNHAYKPNAYYEFDKVHRQIAIYAYQDILVGSEITINYNGSAEDQTKVWFEDNP